MSLISVPNVAPLATPTSPGLISAADQTKLNSLTSGGWYDTTVEAMKAAAPGISIFSYFGFRDMVKTAAPTIGGITATIIDALVAGGGLNFTTSGEYALTPTMLANPRVQPFSFAFRGAFPVPVTGQWTALSFSYNAGSHSHGFMSYYALSTDARTKLVTQSYATSSLQAASSLVIDAAIHTYMYSWDLATVNFFVDGVNIGTIANATNYVSNQPCKMIIDGHSKNMMIQDLIFGY